MLTEQDILEALRACYDPGNPYQQPINLVDLGCVESIALDLDRDAPGFGVPGVPPRQRLTLTLLPTSSDEDAHTQLSAQVHNRLAGIDGLSRTTLHLRKDAWTSARLSAQARRRLRLDPVPFAILNNRR